MLIFSNGTYTQTTEQMVQLSSPFRKMLWWIRETRRSSHALLMVSQCEMWMCILDIFQYFYFVLLPEPHAASTSRSFANKSCRCCWVLLVLYFCQSSLLCSPLHINRREREAHRATASTHSMLEAREFEVKTNLFIQNNESSHVARAQKNNIPIAASGERVHEKCSQHFIMRNTFQMLNFIFLLFFWSIFAAVAGNNAFGYRTAVT